VPSLDKVVPTEFQKNNMVASSTSLLQVKRDQDKVPIAIMVSISIIAIGWIVEFCLNSTMWTLAGAFAILGISCCFGYDKTESWLQSFQLSASSLWSWVTRTQRHRMQVLLLNCLHLTKWFQPNRRNSNSRSASTRADSFRSRSGCRRSHVPLFRQSSHWAEPYSYYHICITKRVMSFFFCITKKVMQLRTYKVVLHYFGIFCGLFHLQKFRLSRINTVLPRLCGSLIYSPTIIWQNTDACTGFVMLMTAY